MFLQIMIWFDLIDNTYVHALIQTRSCWQVLIVNSWEAALGQWHRVPVYSCISTTGQPMSAPQRYCGSQKRSTMYNRYRRSWESMTASSAGPPSTASTLCCTRSSEAENDRPGLWFFSWTDRRLRRPHHGVPTNQRREFLTDFILHININT